MVFGEYLKEQYGIGTPIYLNDIQFESYSRAWISKELKKLVDNGELRRFSNGIYYFPLMTEYGEACLDPSPVVRRRFLSDGNEVYGYVAGISLLNSVGLTTQVPEFLELVTNNEATRVRDIHVGSQLVRARSSRTTITKENANTLQLLDLMNAMDPSEMGATERFMLNEFVRASGATRKSVSQYASFFPAKAMKNMVESKVVFELA